MLIFRIVDRSGTVRKPTDSKDCAEPERNIDMIPERPETWDVLFQNELDLARINYARDTYKLIVDKAKVTFVIAGLTGALVLNKTDNMLLMVASQSKVVRCLAGSLTNYCLRSSCGRRNCSFDRSLD